MVYQDEVKDMNAAIQGVLTLHPTLAGIFCSNADMADLYLNLEKAEKSDSRAGGRGRHEAAAGGGSCRRGAGDCFPESVCHRISDHMVALRVSVEELPEEDKNVILEPVWIDAENIENPAFDSYIY